MSDTQLVLTLSFLTVLVIAIPCFFLYQKLLKLNPEISEVSMDDYCQNYKKNYKKKKESGYYTNFD
jgi:hypothetical protein